MQRFDARDEPHQIVLVPSADGDLALPTRGACLRDPHEIDFNSIGTL